MSGLGWYVRRLRRMSGPEVARRVRDEAVKAYLGAAAARVGRGSWQPDPVAGFRSWPLPPPAALDAVAVARMVAVADAILQGRWPVLGHVRTDMQPAPDWHLDPTTGTRAAADRPSFRINYRDPGQMGNAKQIWELSRHHHLTLLGCAYYATGDDRYADTALRHLRAWLTENPPLLGPNWSSGIELGIRLISWCWLRRLLAERADVADEFERSRTFRRALYLHQTILHLLPSHGSSANNHLVAEAAGQFAAAAAFPIFDRSAAWREAAADDLRREVVGQTFPSGLNREMASDYHGLSAELFAVAGHMGEATGHPLGDAYWISVARQMDAAVAITDVAGRPPRQGDGDDGRALVLDAPDVEQWSALLDLGRHTIGSLDWWPSTTATVCGALLATPGTVGAEHRDRSRRHAFEDAGMYLLRDLDRREDEIWCRVDAGPHGFLSIAPHAHADALAVEVRWGGIDVLADPGTFAYFAAPGWRSYFRSTAAHNTLELAHEDQSVSGGPFNWLRHAESRTLRAAGLDSGAVAEWEGEHTGYRRLTPPATHRRTVSYDRSQRALVVTDVVATEATHPCRLSFHLGPEVDCRLEDSTAVLAVAGGRCVTVQLPGELEWTLHAASGQSRLGWYSPEFGVLEPASVLVGRGRVGAGTVLRSAFGFDVNAQNEHRGPHVAAAGTGGGT